MPANSGGICICVHCALKAYIEWKAVPVFNETPEEHRVRCHPDPITTANEREELEREFSRRLSRTP